MEPIGKILRRNSVIDGRFFGELGDVVIPDVPASGTVDADSYDISTNYFRKYIISIAIPSDDKFRALEMLTSRKGTDVEDNVYSKIGDQISVTIQFLKVGSDGVLRVTNNEAVPITITLRRI